MRSVAELRAIHDAKQVELQNYLLCFAEAEREEMIDHCMWSEPRFWMSFEEWCEFVESNESFSTMARREALRNRGIQV